MNDTVITESVYESWTLEQLAEEANEAAGNADRQAKASHQNKVQAGRMLVQAKSRVSHGEWGAWLEENWKYTQRWATDCMNAAGHRTQQEPEPDDQIGSDFQNETIDATDSGGIDLLPITEDHIADEKPVAAPSTTKQTRKAPPEKSTPAVRVNPIQQSVDDFRRAILESTLEAEERLRIVKLLRQTADELEAKS